MRSTTSSGCACCSTRWRPSAASSTCSAAPSAAEGVRIFIGSENKLFSLSGSSTIIAPYRDGEGRIVGVIGVIGPTRLNYARVIPMVDYTAGWSSQMLVWLSA